MHGITKAATKTFVGLYDAIGAAVNVSQLSLGKIADTFNTDDQEGVYEEAVEHCGIAYLRILSQIDEARQALAELKDAAFNDETLVLDNILMVVCLLSSSGSVCMYLYVALPRFTTSLPLPRSFWDSLPILVTPYLFLSLSSLFSS